jgi:hypothetical protein
MYMMALENPDWYVQKLDITDTGVMNEKDIQAERDAGMDEELIQQEFYCSFEGGASGAYYIKPMQLAENEGRITHVKYDEQLPVDTWWDLGMGDATSIIFSQREPGTGAIRIIDYYESSGEGLAHYAAVIQNKPYIYGTHIGPHDLTVRELGSGVSRIEMARGLGIRFKIAKKLSLEDGINAVRMMLPMCYFDREKCERLIDALLTYHKKWDSTRHTWGDKPDHDWSSHAADAMRTGAVGRRNAKVPVSETRYQLDFNKYGQRKRSWRAA